MKNFIIKTYSIECCTNFHVGTGGDNFGIVDKEVQRDQIDNVPIIHASSLKGAIREFFEESTDVDPLIIRNYFGADKNDLNLQQGLLRFFEARLLAIPVRGISTVSDYLGTSPHLISSYNELKVKLNIATDPIEIPVVNNSNAITEFGNTKHIEEITHVGKNIALFSDEVMNTVLKNLPIIARNSLENGQSENLWYEEVVPRESKFYFFIALPENVLQEYDQHIASNLTSKIIQIGANATVGYGFCKISNIS